MPKTESDLFLQYLVNKGVAKKLCAIPKDILNSVYRPRAKMEMDIISKVGISDYFLMIYGIYKWCRENNIGSGVGRGSIGGSLIAYLIGITEVDPIKYNLLFERFYNAGRGETRQLPDIDFDVSQEHRDRIINEYIIPKYGKEFVAPIGTFGKLQARSAIKHFGRVLQVPLEDTETISKLIPERRGKTGSIVSALEEKDDNGLTKRALTLLEMEKKYPELFKWAAEVEDMEVIQTESIHAAGVVISPIPVGSYVPLRWNASKNIASTSLDMYELESTGALKFDLLGLRNLDIINDTINRAKLGMSYHEFVENINLEDEQTWNLLKSGKGVGVFQFESAFMRKLLKDVEPSSIEDLASINALGRPGPLDAKMDILEEDINYTTTDLPPYLKSIWGNKDVRQLNMIQVYVARRKGELKVRYLCPELEPILKNTQAVLCYQEQIMQIAQHLAGFSLSEADVLRKIVGKKLVDKMPEQETRFIEGCRTKNIEESVARQIWDQIKTFAEYGFNKCLVRGTIVDTKRGPIKIEDIIEGDEVLSLDTGFLYENSKPVWRKVKAIWNNGNKDCVKIRTKSGQEHISTPNHRVMTQRGLVEVKDLTKEDLLVARNFLPRQRRETKWTIPQVRLIAALATCQSEITDVIDISSPDREIAEELYSILAANKATNKSDVFKKNGKFHVVGGISDWKNQEITRSFINELNDDALAILLGFISTYYFRTATTSLRIFPKSKEMALALNDGFSRFGIKTKIDVNDWIELRDQMSIDLFLKYINPFMFGSARKRYEHLSGKTKRPKRINTYFFQDKIDYIKPASTLPVYDIEIEGVQDEHHVFFAGVLTHNSHSVGYSILAYITAYLKTHYPAEFMASLISSDNDIEKRSVWIADAKDTLHLKISPPDINKSQMDFVAKNNEIIFGLKEVKGVGLAAVNSLLEERAKGEFASLRDFYNRVDLGKVNSGRFKSLAYTGAFASLHKNRAELIEWDDIIRERRFKANSRIKSRQEFINGAIELKDEELFSKATKTQLKQIAAGKKTKEEVVEERRQKILADTQKRIDELEDLQKGDYFKDLPLMPDLDLEQILEKETELLGMQISGSLAEPFINEISMYSQTSIVEIFNNGNKDGWFNNLCGVFTQINKTVVKSGPNKGKEMATATFVDLTGKAKVMIVAKAWSDQIISGKPYIIRGKSTEEGTLLCLEVKQIQ